MENQNFISVLKLKRTKISKNRFIVICAYFKITGRTDGHVYIDKRHSSETTDTSKVRIFNYLFCDM